MNMNFFPYFNNFFAKYIALLFITFFSCTETEPIYLENPISNPTFTFMQDQNAVYFSAKFKTEYQERELDIDCLLKITTQLKEVGY